MHTYQAMPVLQLLHVYKRQSQLTDKKDHEELKEMKTFMQYVLLRSHK